MADVVSWEGCRQARVSTSAQVLSGENVLAPPTLLPRLLLPAALNSLSVSLNTLLLRDVILGGRIISGYNDIIF